MLQPQLVGVLHALQMAAEHPDGSPGYTWQTTEAVEAVCARVGVRLPWAKGRGRNQPYVRVGSALRALHRHGYVHVRGRRGAYQWRPRTVAERYNRQTLEGAA